MAPPVSRHAEEIASLIGTQPRPMPEEGKREEPVRVNQEYMEDLMMRREEEIGAKTFISTVCENSQGAENGPRATRRRER